jgi:LuxR family maltose regulon positive regulatory protein
VAVRTGDAIGAERWAALVDAASFDGEKQDSAGLFKSKRALLRALMCAHGPEQMMADAEMMFTVDSEWGPQRDMATLLVGEARLLAGDVATARRFFAEASDISVLRGGTGDGIMAESELALLAMDRGDWEEASHYLDAAQATVEEKRLQDDVMATLVFAGAARLSFHHGHRDEGQAQLASAMRGRPLATHALPFVAVRLRTELAKVYLALGDPMAARQLLREIDDILLRRPRLGTLIVQVEELRQTLADTESRNGTSPLTPAELRLLPYLQTHLTLSAISERLFVSRATVSTQTTSIYRKLGVSSRLEAVEAAAARGLIG